MHKYLFLTIASIAFFSPLLPWHFAQAGVISKPANNLGLVGYWDFNEKTGTIAEDKSGNKNNGVLTNGPTRVAGKSTKFGDAISFDGSDDYVDAGSNSAFDFGSNGNTNSFSIVHWVKFNALSKSQMLIEKFTETAGPGWTWYINSTNGLEFYGCNNGLCISNVIPSPAFATNTWYHVAITRSNVTDFTVYVNGKSVGTASNGNGILSSSKPLVFGQRDPSQPGQVFNLDGSIDDIRIYNRALSADEIAKIYNSGRATPVITSSGSAPCTSAQNCVGYWNFDEGTGTVAKDKSGNGNNGTLTNGPTWVDSRSSGFKKALNFNGSSQYVNVGNPTSLRITGPISICAWVKTSSTAEQGIVVVRSSAGGGYGFRLNVTSGKVRFTYFSVLDWEESGNSALADGLWHHYCVSNPASGVVTLYRDSVSLGTVAGAAGGTANTNDVLLGAGYNGSGGIIDFFNGSIDDVRIYNRALSATEIAAIYNATAPSKTLVTSASQNKKITNGLTGLWSFDGPDMAGVIAYDRSGQANNGTLTNGPVRAIGKLGQALNFDGSDDYVATSKALSTYISASVGSFSAWVKPRGSPVTSVDVFRLPAVISDFDGYAGLHIGITPSGGSDYIWAYNYDGNADKVGASYTVNEWTHIVWVHTGGILYIYKNGVLVDSTASGNTQSLTTNVHIGRTSSVGPSNFNGSLDEVRAYNRALSPDEIKRLYNMGR